MHKDLIAAAVQQYRDEFDKRQTIVLPPRQPIPDELTRIASYAKSQRKRTLTICNLPECKQKASKRSLCPAHYAAVRRLKQRWGIDVKTDNVFDDEARRYFQTFQRTYHKRTPPAQCRIPTCQRDHHAKGLCRRHRDEVKLLERGLTNG